MSARVPCGTCGARYGRHSHAPVPNRVAAGARALGFVLLVAVVLLAAQARAQGLGGAIGDPCAPGYDPDAGVAIVTKGLPDGGLEDVPAAICKDQRAPAHGVFLTVEEASKRAGERAGLRHENELLKQSLTKAGAIPGWVWFVSCVGGVVVTAYVGAHHK